MRRITTKRPRRNSPKARRQALGNWRLMMGYGWNDPIYPDKPEPNNREQKTKKLPWFFKVADP